MTSCHPFTYKLKKKEAEKNPTKHRITIALAGNANVGKSALFNQLTGLNQIVGNWPGKTVERAEGRLHFKGYTIHIVDLPGIYSLSTFSAEEVVSRTYIAVEKPDLIINVVDASALERNLYFTIQLLELEAPILVDLNQVDLAAKKGLRVNTDTLAKSLGVPVVATVAITGMGVNELLSKVIEVVEGKTKLHPLKIRYGKEIEEHVEKLEGLLKEKLPHLCEVYPSRWIAVKLLEKDAEVISKVEGLKNGKEILKIANDLINKIESLHGEPASVVIASERYRIADELARKAVNISSPPTLTLEEKLDEITVHKILGYPILAAVLIAMFSFVFIGGNIIAGSLDLLFEAVFYPFVETALQSLLPTVAVRIIVEGLIQGFVAGVTIALPYIIPFYIILAILEDSGYLPRAAFLMDNLMHKIGLHGKAFIPLILGYGCNVPACIGCRIMETARERLIAAFVVVLIPCAARTVVILGLVGRYVGLHAALALYVFDLFLVFLLGRIAFKTLPGEPIGLIMEMPVYRKPTLHNVALKTWSRTKDFVYIAFPLIIGGSVVLTILNVTGTLQILTTQMNPLTQGWLGLPLETGIPLIFGVLRKELTLILLATQMPLTALTATQMIVFALVTMIYIPCVATIAALVKELGWKNALLISILTIFLALLLGGITFRILSLLLH